MSEADVIFKHIISLCTSLIPPQDPDAPPRALNVTPTSSGLRIAWDAPAVLSGPTSYLVQVISLSFISTDTNTDVLRAIQRRVVLYQCLRQQMQLRGKHMV